MNNRNPFDRNLAGIPGGTIATTPATKPTLSPVLGGRMRPGQVAKVSGMAGNLTGSIRSTRAKAPVETAQQPDLPKIKVTEQPRPQRSVTGAMHNTKPAPYVTKQPSTTAGPSNGLRRGTPLLPLRQTHIYAKMGKGLPTMVHKMPQNKYHGHMRGQGRKPVSSMNVILPPPNVQSATGSVMDSQMFPRTSVLPNHTRPSEFSTFNVEVQPNNAAFREVTLQGEKNILSMNNNPIGIDSSSKSDITGQKEETPVVEDSMGIPIITEKENTPVMMDTFPRSTQENEEVSELCDSYQHEKDTSADANVLTSTNDNKVDSGLCESNPQEEDICANVPTFTQDNQVDSELCESNQHEEDIWDNVPTLTQGKEEVTELCDINQYEEDSCTAAAAEWETLNIEKFSSDGEIMGDNNEGNLYLADSVFTTTVAKEQIKESIKTPDQISKYLENLWRTEVVTTDHIKHPHTAPVTAKHSSSAFTTIPGKPTQDNDDDCKPCGNSASHTLLTELAFLHRLKKLALSKNIDTSYPTKPQAAVTLLPGATVTETDLLKAAFKESRKNLSPRTTSAQGISAERKPSMTAFHEVDEDFNPENHLKSNDSKDDLSLSKENS